MNYFKLICFFFYRCAERKAAQLLQQRLGRLLRRVLFLADAVPNGVDKMQVAGYEGGGTDANGRGKIHSKYPEE